ncbi:TIGR03503 family protein [Kushneria avicenniae]|uniref:TIGR03503 family protein n=1 Tax=Kushneria avicenniae TaxID=402385 RepID=A0A1I1ITS5_9GAMM|nr:vWA domain-containing protein [Kushneria avicenniae]SFC36630.1 TIGR03503 family protein [Kushneria avicenniae]
MLYRWLVTGAWLLLMLMALPAQASSQASPEQGDVRLAIDVSGSMKDNDPDNLRASGIRLLVDLLPDSSRAGLWTFGQHVANPLGMGTVNDQWRQRALDVLPRMTRYEQFTDLESALDMATQGVAGDRKTHLIVLTDGMVDVPAINDKPARDRASRERIIRTLAPDLAERNVVIHTIALSRNADTDLMRTISQETGGLASVAEDSRALLRSFLDVLNQVAPRQQLPLENGRFQVDDQVREFTALIFHEQNDGPVTLISPDGERLSIDAPGVAGRWRHDDRYELITVPEPAVGEWRIEGPVGAGSRILIDSSLQLRSATIPATLYAHIDQPLDVWLEGRNEQGSASSAPTVDATLRDADGDITSTRLQPESDGHYRGRLEQIDRVGNAELALRARGDGFSRLLTHSVNVVPVIDAVLAGDQSHIAMTAAWPRLTRDNTRIEATLLGETLDVAPAGEGRWQVTLPDTLPEESVSVALTATVALDNRILEIPLPPVALNSDAATSLSGARLDRDAISGERMIDQQSDDQDQPWSLQRLWGLAQDNWPAARAQAIQWLKDPRAWWVAAALLLLYVLLAFRRRRLRHRRPPQRRDPSV